MLHQNAVSEHKIQIQTQHTFKVARDAHAENTYWHHYVYQKCMKGSHNWDPESRFRHQKMTISSFSEVVWNCMPKKILHQGPAAEGATHKNDFCAAEKEDRTWMLFGRIPILTTSPTRQSKRMCKTQLFGTCFTLFENAVLIHPRPHFEPKQSWDSLKQLETLQNNSELGPQRNTS